VGPCNFQCRLTSEGVRVFEVNTRFTGITGVRAAMGWNEVEAVVRRMAFDEPVDAVRASLRRRYDVLGMRYVDEKLVSRRAFEELAG
jgi:carbamoylphosphate synthase large subunit